MTLKLSWLRCALAVLGLWAFVPGCKNSEPDGNTPPDAAGEPDAGGPDGGHEPTPDGGLPDGGTGDGGTQTSDGVGFIGYVLPASNAEAVPRNARVIVGFAEALDVSTVSAEVLTVSENGVAVAGTVTHDPATRTLTFTPGRPFAADTLVTVGVSTALRLVTGKSLPAPYQSVFTVGLEADTSPPEVLATRPLNGESRVAPTWPVYTLSFREPMDPRTLTGDTLRFEQVLGSNPAAPLTGVISYDAPSQSVSFRVSPLPAPGALVTGTLSTGAKDLAGNALTQAHAFAFFVTASSDTTAPRVQETLPATTSVGVAARYAPIIVHFSEPLRPESVTPDRVYLEELNTDGTQVVRRVQGTLRYDDAKLHAAFTPNEPLKYQTRYRGRVRAVEDLAGNTLALFDGFHFVTELEPSPPVVRDATPAPDARFVPLGSPLRVSFDRPLDPATVNARTVGVEGVTGLVNYESSTNTVVFRPVPPFAPATNYTVTVKDVQTPQGAGLASPHTYTVRTVAPGVRVSAGRPGQPGMPVFATGPRGTLAVWNEDTGTAIQVRAAFDSGSGFGDSVLVGEGRSMTLAPQVSAWGERFVVGWSDGSLAGGAVALFDGTDFSPVTPGISGRLFGVGNHLYALNGKTFRVHAGTQWSEVFTAANLGSPVSLLQNGDRVLVSSGRSTTLEVSVVFDGVRWLESTVSSSVDAQYIRVGDSFGRAWVSNQGVEFALFNRDAREWGLGELITSEQMTSLRIASDGSTITAVLGDTGGLFASVRANGAWQAPSLVDNMAVRDIWAVVPHRGNYVALWTGINSATLVRAVSQTGVSWSSTSKVVVASGVSSVLDVRASGDDLLVLMQRTQPSSTAEIWGAALTSQGWQPSVQLRGREATSSVLVPVGARVGALFVQPGRLVVRGYLGGGQWDSGLELVTPALVGSVRDVAVHFESDGHGAAAWEQFDAGAWSLFLAEFDGTVWMEPVRVGPAGTKVRVAVDDNGVVVAYLQPSTQTDLMDIWVVSSEAGVVGAPQLLDSVAATDPDLALVHGPSGFMAVWGEWEIRGARSVDGVAWRDLATLIPRVFQEARWYNTRLATVGESFALSAQRNELYLNMSIHTEGVWQPIAAPVMPSDVYEFVAAGNSVMLMAPFDDEFRYIFHNGIAWSGQNIVKSPADGQGVLAASPSGFRMHTDKSWWRWSGTEWLKEATDVSRPYWAGSLRCDAKGCGLATGAAFNMPVNLALSYASGTRSFWTGASPAQGDFPVQAGSVTWDFVADTYRVTWRQPVQQGVLALHASTAL